MKLRVPNASRCIPASGDENVECWVQVTESVCTCPKGVCDSDGGPCLLYHLREVFLLARIWSWSEYFQNMHLMLCTGEQIRMSQRDSEGSYGRDMTREGELELTGRKVPYLNDSVACPSDKPLVSRFDNNRLYLTKMPRNHMHEFPLQMVRRIH